MSTASLTKTLRDGRTVTITRRDLAWTVEINGATHATGCKVTPLDTPIGKGAAALTYVVGNGTDAPIGITRREATQLRNAANYLDPKPHTGPTARERCVECGGPLRPYGDTSGLTGADLGRADCCYDCA